MPAPLRIFVSGMIAADPHAGGATWATLQYVLGLRELGHEVTFVESLPPAKLRPAGATLAESINARYFIEITKRFDLRREAALLLSDTSGASTVGLDDDELHRRAGKADLLLNLSGILSDRALLEPIPRRVYLDLDPGFTQLWHLHGSDVRLANHTHFVTIGVAIGQADCRVPRLDRPWITTLQPIVLSRWPAADLPRADAPITTVGNWRSYGSVEHDGVMYGQRVHSMRPLMTLPRRVPTETFAPALSIDASETKDLAALAHNGWQLQDPAIVCRDADSYANFIRASKAELGIAKSGYVAADCGWFSDRSVCFLASGRPVIAQETGFSRFLPTGNGLFAFRSLDEAASAIESLRSDYPRHARTARRLAVEHFDSRQILTALLQKLGVAP